MANPPSKLCAVCGRAFYKQPSHSQRYWAVRKCCSRECSIEIRRGRPNPKAAAANRGHKVSVKTRRKMSKSMKRAYAEGRMVAPLSQLGLRKDQTSQWKGDDIKYRAAHARLKAERGQAAKCETCGTVEGFLEWALVHEPEVLKIEVGGREAGLKFSTVPSDYIALCRRCHRAYDRQ